MFIIGGIVLIVQDIMDEITLLCRMIWTELKIYWPLVEQSEMKSVSNTTHSVKGWVYFVSYWTRDLELLFKKKDVPYKNTDQFTSNTNNDLFWPHCVWHDAWVFGVVMWKTIQTVYNYVWVQGLCFQAYETFWYRFRILLLNLNLNCIM